MLMRRPKPVNRTMNSAQILMAATNPIGRIAKGDLLVVDFSAPIKNGHIVVCDPGCQIKYYDAVIDKAIIGRVIKFYTDPLP